jgi:hypothetical protein
MEIKFVKLLDQTGDGYNALFEVDGKHVKIGVSDTTLSVWNIQRTKEIITLFLRQFGTLKIRLMLAENNLHDYVFTSDHFKKEDGDTLTLEDLDDYLKNKIIETEDRKKS